MAEPRGTAPTRWERLLLAISRWARWAITELELRAFGESDPGGPAGGTGLVLEWYHAQTASLAAADSSIQQLAGANRQLEERLRFMDGARRDAVERYLAEEDRARELAVTLAEVQQECEAWESSGYQLDAALTEALGHLQELQARFGQLEAEVAKGCPPGVDQQRQVEVCKGGGVRRGRAPGVPG